MRRPRRERLPPLEQIPGLPYRGAGLPPISAWPRRRLLLVLVIAAAAGFIPVAGLVPHTTPAPPGFIPVAGLARYPPSDPSYCLPCHAAGDTPDRGVRSLVHPDFKEVGCVDCHARPEQVVFEGYVKGFMAEPE